MTGTQLGIGLHLEYGQTGVESSEAGAEVGEGSLLVDAVGVEEEEEVLVATVVQPQRQLLQGALPRVADPRQGLGMTSQGLEVALQEANVMSTLDCKGVTGGGGKGQLPPKFWSQKKS